MSFLVECVDWQVILLLDAHLANPFLVFDGLSNIGFAKRIKTKTAIHQKLS